MRYINLILATIVLGLASCSTMYKSGQTPDDVYYSPERIASDYVSVESDRNDRFNSDDYYSSDRYLRMKSIGRNRWSTFDDDFYYWNNPTWNNPHYFNSMYSPWSNPWVGNYNIYSYNYWNSGFYNPFLPGFYSAPVVIVSKPVNPRAYAPRGGNLSSYTYSPSTIDPKTGGRTYNISSNTNSSRSSNSNRGNYYTTPSNRTYQYSNSSSNSSPSRSFNSGSSNSTPSTNSGSRSSSSGSSSSGSAPVRSFPRGGGN